jgi:hypothetical protein
METASYFAKKHGLESFLDRPAELNALIFKLLVLQETLHAEQARKRERSEATARPISVRRIVQGKFTALCAGDPAYRYAVETALRSATVVAPLFRFGRFVNALRSMGVPEERIREYSDSIMLSDDTLCIDPE